jgi:hypothetical protein
MARFPNGILGGLAGTIGPIIGSSRNGVPYLKSRYAKRKATNHPNEIANRQKFAAAHAFLHPLLKVVREGFRTEGKSQGFTAAKSWLLKNAFEGEWDNLHINPALVKLSMGDLHLPTNITVKMTEPFIFEFSWDPSPPKDNDAKDQAVLVAYSIEKAHPIYTMAGAFRYSGVDRLQVDLKDAATYHLYIWFVSADRTRRSESMYLGSWDLGK